jgi:hypothetical protein
VSVDVGEGGAAALGPFASGGDAPEVSVGEGAEVSVGEGALGPFASVGVAGGVVEDPLEVSEDPPEVSGGVAGGVAPGGVAPVDVPVGTAVLEDWLDPPFRSVGLDAGGVASVGDPVAVGVALEPSVGDPMFIGGMGGIIPPFMLLPPFMLGGIIIPPLPPFMPFCIIPPFMQSLMGGIIPLMLMGGMGGVIPELLIELSQGGVGGGVGGIIDDIEPPQEPLLQDMELPFIDPIMLPGCCMEDIAEGWPSHLHRVKSLATLTKERILSPLLQSQPLWW